MSKQIVILDPNGVEVASRSEEGHMHLSPWPIVVHESCEDLAAALAPKDPKFGTYTVTVKEVE